MIYYIDADLDILYRYNPNTGILYTFLCEECGGAINWTTVVRGKNHAEKYIYDATPISQKRAFLLIRLGL